MNGVPVPLRVFEVLELKPDNAMRTKFYCRVCLAKRQRRFPHFKYTTIQQCLPGIECDGCRRSTYTYENKKGRKWRKK